MFLDLNHDRIIGIDTWDMYDEDYDKFVMENGDKEIIKLRPEDNNLFGLILIRKGDKALFKIMHVW